MANVVVAMSGGVDSSVAAALLLQQGHRVTGMMLRLWSEAGTEDANRCCTPDAMAQARRVAALLGIPFYVIDAKEYFYNQIVRSFVNGYAQGITPNPCLICNRYVRWGFLLQRALDIGADYFATGHYARILAPQAGHPYQLLRAVDRQKDQSYVLHVLDQARLSRTLLPVGDYTKPEVRALAQKFNLPVARRPDSQDLCFLAGDDYRRFLLRNAPHLLRPGPIITRSGQVLGQHQGLAFYTIGQRKGLGISAGRPLYVIGKDLHQNALLVGDAFELGQQELNAKEANWISGEAPSRPFQAEVKIRYTAQAVSAWVSPLDGERFHVRFDVPVRDITPGQAAVIYTGETCLGGGIIE